jgi:hypothetical protein
MLMYLSFYLYDRCILAQDCYVLSYRQSIEKGDADRAGEGAAREQFGQKLYAEWKTQHEPYWALNDPRQYTFNATLASFQLGVSMILEKLGY